MPRGPQRQAFVVGVEMPGVPNDRPSSLGWRCLAFGHLGLDAVTSVLLSAPGPHFYAPVHSKQNPNNKRLINKLSLYLSQNQRIFEKIGQFSATPYLVS